MTKFKTFFLIIIFGLLVSSFIFAESEEGTNVYLTEVNGEIKAGTLQYLKRAVGEAEAARAEYLVIKLDTPGGLLKSTKDIVDLILATRVKTVVFVHKEGGWAYSAGTFILLSADFAFAHPTASIGACQPQEIFGQGEEAGDKVVEGVVSWIKGLAEIQGRSPEIAERFVRENLTLTGREAEEIGIIDGTARNSGELFLKLEIVDPKVRQIYPTPVEKFFDFLSHPYLISLFLTLGGLGLIFAFRTGEFELSGILGLILLLIGLWGMGVITFNILGIIFLALGLFLLFLEIFEPGFGIFGFFGIISLIFGIFSLEGEPFSSPQIFDAVTMFVLGAVLGISVLFVIISRGAAKTFKQKPKTGTGSLIGLEAKVVKKLSPGGLIEIKGEIWSAESLDKKIIPKGAKVKIIRFEGNTIYVKKNSQ